MSSETESDIETSVPAVPAATAATAAATSPSRITVPVFLKAIDERIKIHPELIELLKGIPLPSTYKGPLLTEEAKAAAKAAKAAGKTPAEKKPKEVEPKIMVDGKPVPKPHIISFEEWYHQNYSVELAAKTKKDQKTDYEKYLSDNKDTLNEQLKKDWQNYDKLQKEKSEWATNPNKIYNDETHRWRTVKQKKSTAATAAAPVAPVQ